MATSFSAMFFILNLNKSKNTLNHLPETYSGCNFSGVFLWQWDYAFNGCQLYLLCAF